MWVQVQVQAGDSDHTERAADSNKESSVDSHSTQKTKAGSTAAFHSRSSKPRMQSSSARTRSMGAAGAADEASLRSEEKAAVTVQKRKASSLPLLYRLDSCFLSFALK
jgi:hypothetical protein